MSQGYYKTKNTVEEYIQLSKHVDSKNLIDKLEHFLPKQAKLLEIGSGPGTDWNILNKRYNTTGSDNSKIFLKHLFDENPEGNFMELDAITLDTTFQFDGIYSNKVMQHLTDKELMASIKRQHEILNANGIICHSFWKGEGSEFFKGMLVNYHTENTLEKAFNTDFEILLIEDYQEFEENDSLVLIGKKRQPLV